MGSTPHAHAVAKVKYPAQQGFVAIVGVFVDTFIVLNMTAFVIFVTNSIDGSTTGIALTQKAFESGLGSFGITFVAICLFFFAFSTIIGWYFFGEQNIKYLFGTKGTTPYRLIVMGFIVLGSVLQVDLVWELAVEHVGQLHVQRPYGPSQPHRPHRAFQDRQHGAQRLRREQSPLTLPQPKRQSPPDNRRAFCIVPPGYGSA